MDWNFTSFLKIICAWIFSLNSLFLFIFANGFLENSAVAYPTPVDFDGSLMRWPISIDNPNITYELSAEGGIDAADFAGIVAKAASLWNMVDTSYLKLVSWSMTSADPAQISIVFVDQLNDGGVSAGYAVFDQFSNKTPTHCSIRVIIDNYLTYNNIAKTILHELGHCVGLGHTLIPEAIMSYSLEKNRFALDIDDKAAITSIYPIDGAKPRLPPGCSLGIDQAPEKGEVPLINIILLLSIPMAVSSRCLTCGRWKPLRHARFSREH